MNDKVKIITEPNVYLIGRQQVDREGLGRFLEDNGSPDWRTDAMSPGEALVEVAGRACYNSYITPRPGGNAAYIDHILEVQHGSVCEHAVLTILIDGVSRTLSHELVRHRQGIGISQESQRYVDASDCAFVVPPALLEEVAAADELFKSGWGNPEYDVDECDCLLRDESAELTDMERAGVNWFRSNAVALAAYREASDYLFRKQEFARLDRIRRSREGRYPTGPLNQAEKTAIRKAAREAARSVLPGCAATRIVITANARALRWLCELRGSWAADAEFRRLAVTLCRLFKAEWPNLFADCEVAAGEDGSECVTVKHHKV